jgi:transposase-like protein
MPVKKHKPEEIIGKLREVEIMLGQGGTTAEACRRIAVSEQTYYRWRNEFGGLKTASVPVVFNPSAWPRTRLTTLPRTCRPPSW